MLCAVWNGTSNYLRFNPIGTAYTVDWGDGSALENIASDTPASHNFSWAGCSGSTLTSIGHRQAIVQVYPQSSGQFSALILNLKHASAASGSSTPILDFECSSPNATLPQFTNGTVQSNYMQHFKAHSAFTPSAWSTQNFWSLLAMRQYEGLELSAPTSTIQAFYGNASLVQAPELNTAGCSDMNNMFQACSRLVSVPAYDYSATSSVAGMFQNCFALRTIGAMNTGNSTSFASTFAGCRALTSLPAVDTTKATTLQTAFTGCASLVTFPTLNTPANLSLNNTFQGCTSMVTAPAMDTSKVTDMTSVFSGCTSLTSVPLYDTSKVTTASQMFQNCSSLRTIPLLDTSKVTVMSAMFLGCSALTAIPAFDLTACVTTTQMFWGTNVTSITALTNTSGIVTATQMFGNCLALQVVSINLSGATSVANLFQTNLNMRSVTLTGLRYGFTVASNLLQASDLDALYTSLGTAVGAQTVTVTSNPGTTADTPSIATTKGWTVAGS